MQRGIPPVTNRIAVVIPSYNVERHIASVIQSVPSYVTTIIVVDDASPDKLADRVQELNDHRVTLIRHAKNQGVGGAMVTGYKECLRRGVDIVVKMDGDGQMDPGYLPALLRPLLLDKADYAKGNRWHDQAALLAMPGVRRIGNLGLSFLAKLATGNWTVFDPSNGYTAIRTSALRQMPLERLARGYFFETSILAELTILGAVTRDVPMRAIYGDEKSSLRIGRVLRTFPYLLAKAFTRRVWNQHFIRNFGPISLFLLGGSLLFGWGVGFGLFAWARGLFTGTPATAGTVMFAALPLLMGFQLLLQALVLDMSALPTVKPQVEEDGRVDILDDVPFATRKGA